MTEEMSVQQRSALGRDGFLGDLYNAYTDQFCGLNIFKSSPPDDLFQRQDTNNSDYVYSMSDTISEKFDKLNVEGALKLSCIGNLLSLASGSGRYIKDGNKSEKSVSCSYIYRVHTKSEKFNFLNTDIGRYIDFTALKHTKATHVVQKINWGANAVITLEGQAKSEHDIRDIKASLELGLKCLDVTADGQFKTTSESKSRTNNYRLKIVADVLPDTLLPQTIEDALLFIGKVPKLIEKSNNGLGKPLVFHFFPISEVRRIMNLSDLRNEIILKELGEDQVVRNIAFFEQITTLQRKLYDKVALIKEKEKCLKLQYINDALILQTDVQTFEGAKKEQLSKELMAYRKGDLNLVNVIDYKQVQIFNERILALQPAIEIIRRYDMFIELGAIFVGSDGNLDSELLNIDTTFILFLSESCITADKERFLKNTHTFINLIKSPNSNAKFIVCDLDLCKYRDITSVCIWQYVRGLVISKDYFLDSVPSNDAHSRKVYPVTNIPLGSYNYMYCGNKLTAVSSVDPLIKRTILLMICPGILKDGPCEFGKKLWKCRNCKANIEYGFDSYFYCNCGKGQCEDYLYRCGHEKHVNYIPLAKAFLDEYLDKMQHLEILNILVVGPFRAGKTTWLNSIINYLTYDSLNEAQGRGVLCATPVSFTVWNDQLEEQIVTLGEDDDAEFIHTGQTGTLRPKTYYFLLGTKLLQITDTPGICGAWNERHNRENLINILKHIKPLSEFHGICIVCKSNDTQLRVLMGTFIRELLTAFNESAIKNIIFCFTHAGVTFGRPGNALTVVNQLLKQISNELKTSKDNVYCFDNESFRFLCALKQPNITYNACEKASFQTSWDKSVKETKRMFLRIERLPPCKVKEQIRFAMYWPINNTPFYLRPEGSHDA